MKDEKRWEMFNQCVLLILVWVLIAFCLLAGCKSPEIVTHTDVKTEYIRTYIPYALPADSATALALLECTESGQVTILRLNVEASKNARMSLTIDSLNNLKAKTVFERDTLYLPSDSVILERDVLRTSIEYKDKELTGWQNFKQEVGGWAFGVGVFLVVALIIYVLRRFKIL